jgi:hypothetical protein
MFIGAGPAIVPAGSEGTYDDVPAMFVAATVTRIFTPAAVSPATGVYVLLVSPGIAFQVVPPSVDRCHWYE